MEEACACYDDLNPDQRRAFALIMQASPLMRSTGANELHVLCAMHQRFGPPSQASVVQPLVEGAVGGGAGGQQGGITHGAPRRRGMVVGGEGKGGVTGGGSPDAAASSSTAEDKDKDGDEPRSLFGRAAYARACHAVTEAQARGALHLHILLC